MMQVDGVEPMLYPLCRKDLAHQGPRFVVTVGDKTVDYNENFCMYLVTRNPTPDIPPDAASLVTQVNFTVTRSGLEGQLLGLAIQHEQPELEREKGEMLKREEDFKMQLSALEKDLLQGDRPLFFCVLLHLFPLFLTDLILASDPIITLSL